MRPHDDPRWLQRRLKKPPKLLRRAPRGAPGGPQEAKNNVFLKLFIDFWILAHVSGLPSAKNSPGTLQDRPKRAEDAFKMVQDGPTTPRPRLALHKTTPSAPAIFSSPIPLPNLLLLLLIFLLISPDSCLHQ